MQGQMQLKQKRPSASLSGHQQVYQWLGMPGAFQGIPGAELPELQQKAIDLLDLLQKNLPDKTREKAKWNFEKEHSILHKVREIVLWGNSDNTSCQAPEVSTNMYVHVCTLYAPCS